MLRRDWAVRVLDAWVEKHAYRSWRSSNDVTDRRVTVYESPRVYDWYAGATPDEARMTAAKSVYLTLSRDEQARLGVCP